MPGPDLELGGGYTYQWQCAILLALNYFFEPVSYDDTLHELVSKFGQVEAVHLESKTQDSEVELEDINLLFEKAVEPGARRILIQVKTKKSGQWTFGAEGLCKALYHFYRNASLDEVEANTRFVFLSNRQFNDDLGRLAEAIQQGKVAECSEAGKLFNAVDSYAIRKEQEGGRPGGKREPFLDKERFLRMLSRTALVDFLKLSAVKANVQAMLQGYDRSDWSQAYDRLFTRFAELSTQKGGGRVTRELMAEILGLPVKIPPSPKRHDYYRLGYNDLPPNYIPRPELLAKVREKLLLSAGGLALTSAIRAKKANVLHGMGGIGKSVLARALCDDPQVQAAFPNGILWATLGQKPELTVRLREWIEELDGTVAQTAPTLDQLRDTLAKTLEDKACLLIVDDVWEKAHVEKFCAGGPACRLLITTRDAANRGRIEGRGPPCAGHGTRPGHGAAGGVGRGWARPGRD